MKIRNISLIVIGFSIVLMACRKDVLDKKPLDVLTEENVWTDVNLGRAYINQLYASLPGGIERDLDGTTEIEDGNKQDTRTYAVGEVTAVNSPFSSSWETYSVIARINKFLENFNPPEAEQEEIDGLKGEALFLRAFFYRELNDLFGGVPIVEKVQSLDDDLLVGRNTYEECVEFILTDLDQAAALLPDPADAEVGRANKGAALALKSRVLLYAASPLHNPGNDPAKWQRASDAALAVIDGGFGYALYPNYNELFLNDNNEEVIFDIQYQFPFRTTSNDYTLNPQGLNGAFGNSRPTQNLVDRYEMANGKEITDATSGYDPNNPYENRDERFYGTILYNGVEWRGIEIETFFDGAFGPGVNDTYSTGAHMTGYYLRKFLNQNEDTNPIIFQDNRADQNWILIRYAEILLNYAEAQLALGNENTARDYINMVRARANQPDLPASVTGAALQERYVNERTIELAFEEQHYFDIRRWKLAPELHAGTIFKMEIENDNGNFIYSIGEMEERIWNDAYYYLPIPQEEIDKNENLSQNEGY